jgi:hypothetical protein
MSAPARTPTMESMIQKWFRSAVATLVMSCMALGAAVQPAKADTTSTLLITAAAVAALMTGINVAEKTAKANQLVGYLPNGSPVYADGHVVAANGQTWYPGNYGENLSCTGGRCMILGAGYGGGYGNPGAYGGGYPGAYGGYAPNYGYAPNGYAPTTVVNRYVRTIYVDGHDNGLHKGWYKNHNRDGDRDDNDRDH